MKKKQSTLQTKQDWQKHEIQVLLLATLFVFADLASLPYSSYKAYFSIKRTVAKN